LDEAPTTKRRTSITKSQRETAAASELIALCQTMTADGHLADDEIAALRQWLVDHQGADLPAITFLQQTVERILADGKVTPLERRELYLAIETVLPPDVRAAVRGARSTADRVARMEQQLEKEAVVAERERNYAIDTWDFIVAGVKYEGRADVARRFAQVGDVAFLLRDRRNRHSPHAIEVRLSNGMQVGFVPEEHAVDIAPLLDAGHKHGAHIKKLWSWEGGDIPYPIIVASLFAPDCARPDALAERDVPAAQKPLILEAGARGKRGCLPLVLVAVAVAAMACVVALP
jgi:hypothetical protein